MTFFIKGNVPSSKNSKQIFKNKKTGKTFITSSKTVKAYLSNFEYQYDIFAKEFKEQLKSKAKPYKIGFYFVRDSRRKFDYININQIVQDLMVQHGWIDDDNCEELIPVFIGYEVDRNNPGVRIEVL